MYNSTEQFVLDKQFNLLEEKFDEVIVEGITPENVGVLLKEAFNSEPYSLKELQIKGSEVNYIFADENDEDFRLQFIGAGGAFGKNTDSVYIGKRRGNSKIFVDSIDKLSNPARIVSSMITYLNDYLLNKGKSKVGFAINLSGKAGVRFAPFLKKLIDRTLRSKLKVVKGNYDPINGRKFVWAYDSTKKPEEVFNGKKITDEAPWFKRDEIEDKATSDGVEVPVSKARLKELDKYLQNEINRKIKKYGSNVGVTAYITEPVAMSSDKEKFSILIVSKFDGGLVKSYPSIYQSSMDTSSQTYILGDAGRIADLSLELHNKAKISLAYIPVVNTRTEEITSDDSNKRFGTLGYVTNDMGSSLKVGETLNWFSFYSGKPEKFEVIAKTPEHVDLKSTISGKYFRYSISMWNPESDQKDLVNKAPQDKDGHTAPGLKPQEIETPEPQTGFNAEIALEYKELKSMSLSSLKNEIKRINKIVDLSGYDKEGAISDILEARFGRKKVISHFKAVDMGGEPTKSKMDSKGQMKPFSISNLPPIVKGLLKTGIKTFTNTSTHPANPDVHNWYFDTVGSTGKITTEDNDSKLAALSIEDKAIKSIETTISFKFIPSLDPVDVIKAALDKTKVLVCGTTSQRDKMSLLSGLPKRSTNFTKTAKAIETYIQSRFKEAGIVAKIVPSGSGLNIASVYIDNKYFHVTLDYRMPEKLTTEIRSLNPAVKIVHEDKIYDTPEQARQAVFVKSIDKLVELISEGYTSDDEKPDISDNYSIEDAVASKDPSILGAKGLWMRGLLLNEAIEDVGFTFRWGMPKTGEMKTFISNGFVRNGKTLNAETAKGEVALFKVVGVDPKVTPAGFNSKEPVEISAKEFLTMLREYPAFSTLLDGGDVYGGSDNGDYNYELETLYGPSTIDIKIVGNELQAIMRDDEGSVMGKAKHTNISDIKVSMDSIISSLDNTVEEFFGDTFDAVHKETSLQQGKQDKFGFKIPTQTSHSKSSTGIGDIVRLKTPINGIMYASVSGFGLAKGSRLIGGAPAPGSKVTVLKAKLKVTPLFRVDYLGDVEIEKGQYITVDNSKENKLWRELNPDYSEKLDKLGIN